MGVHGALGEPCGWMMGKVGDDDGKVIQGPTEGSGFHPMGHGGNVSYMPLPLDLKQLIQNFPRHPKGCREFF